MNSLSRAPEVLCSGCGVRFWESSYFEMQEGSEVVCPVCGQKMRVLEVEMVMYWTMCTEQDWIKKERLEEERRKRAVESLKRAREKGGEGL